MSTARWQWLTGSLSEKSLVTIRGFHDAKVLLCTLLELGRKAVNENPRISLLKGSTVFSQEG
jgi:hypothetical protein